MDLTSKLCECRWIYAIVFISTLILVYQVSAIKDYELGDHCDTEISMILRDVYQVRLIISSNLPHYNWPKCDVEVESWYSFPRMMFYFETYNLTCEQSLLEFFDGSLYNGDRVKGLESTLCGHSKPEGIYVTDNMDLNIRFTENSQLTGHNIVVAIIVTAFRNKPCESYYYECDNGRCIHEDINCSGYNPCGDNSDCQTQLGTWTWLGIIVGCLVGVVGIIIVVIVVICYCKTAKTRSQMQQRQANYNVNSGRTTFSQQQPFIPGQQQASPSNQQHIQGDGQNQCQRSYPTQAPTTYPYPQTDYGVQHTTYSQHNIPTQPTAPVLDTDPPAYSTLFSTARDGKDQTYIL